MPHFQIDYSANLEDVINMGDFCEAVRAKAATIETFPMAGIRVRATRVDHYAIADGDPKHAFIDISVRIREGRADDVKQAAIAEIFKTAKEFLAAIMADHSIALSAELRDIDAALSPKFGTIRDHIKETK